MPGDAKAVELAIVLDDDLACAVEQVIALDACCGAGTTRYTGCGLTVECVLHSQNLLMGWAWLAIRWLGGRYMTFIVMLLLADNT